jgi:hypothetical protein
MKNKLIKAAVTCACLLLTVQFARAQVGTTDLSMRRALYFTGAKTDKIDLKNDRYVAENGTITLKQSDATKCEDGGCYFNIGFIAFRRPTGGALSSYALIGKNIGFDGIELEFPDKAGTLQRILSIKLPIGSQNKLTFQIDPYKKTLETDENNNSFSVTVIVEGKP